MRPKDGLSSYSHLWKRSHKGDPRVAIKPGGPSARNQNEGCLGGGVRVVVIKL